MRLPWVCYPPCTLYLSGAGQVLASPWPFGPGTKGTGQVPRSCLGLVSSAEAFYCAGQAKRQNRASAGPFWRFNRQGYRAVREESVSPCILVYIWGHVDAGIMD